jgi:osmoprotectant transport system substrate-binding protein
MKLTSITVALAGATLLAGCSLGDPAPSNVEAGSLAAGADLDGAHFTVGGKEFTEQLVLCEVTAEALESAGASVDRSCGLSGSSAVRSALQSGDIDLYWEYTGTGWLTHLGESELVNDPDKLYTRLARTDADKNGIDWLKPAPANNTYALAVASETAEKLGLATLSDYAKLASTDPEDASLCGAAEFFGRDDGWDGLQDAYGFHLAGDLVSELAGGAIYSSIDKGTPCVVGEVFATDGRIAALDMTVLQDDKQFFPVYNPSVAVNSEVLEQNPGVERVLAPVAAALDDETLQALNAKVDVDGLTPEQVAKDWLVQQGFVK